MPWRTGRPEGQGAEGGLIRRVAERPGLETRKYAACQCHGVHPSPLVAYCDMNMYFYEVVLQTCISLRTFMCTFAVVRLKARFSWTATARGWINACKSRPGCEACSVLLRCPFREKLHKLIAKPPRAKEPNQKTLLV